MTDDARRMVERDREYEAKHKRAFARYMEVYDAADATSESRVEASDQLTREQAALDRVYADVLKWRARRDRHEDREALVDVLACDVRDVLAFVNDDAELSEMLTEAVERGRQMHKESQ